MIYLFIFILCALAFCLHVCLFEGVSNHLKLDYGQLRAATWVVGIEPVFSGEIAVLPTSEPSLQAQDKTFMIVAVGLPSCQGLCLGIT